MKNGKRKNTKMEMAGGVLACVAACAVGSLTVLHLMGTPATAATPAPVAQLAVTSYLSCAGPGLPTIAVDVQYVSGSESAQVLVVDNAGRRLPLLTVTPQSRVASVGGSIAPGDVGIILIDGSVPDSTDLSPVAPSC